MKRFSAYKVHICSIKWFRKRVKSVTAIKICLQIYLFILSEGVKLTSPRLEIVSLCKIKEIDLVLLYLLLTLNKLHTSF